MDKINGSSENIRPNEGTLTNENKKKKTYEAILLLKNFTNKINARIFFFVVPNKQLTLQNQCCESDTLAVEFYNFTEENDLKLIDLPKAFENYLDQSKLFFEKDVHFTAEGHSVTAEAISNRLKLSEKK